MKIKSLVREHDSLIPVDVEINFTPGLPQIQFLGLPDQGIKESIHKIKSAIRAQGFEFPKAQQVLVNLRPNHLKKSSRGVELAVALGILWESEQVPKPSAPEILVYGELGLLGEVFEPDDLVKDFELDGNVPVWTGRGMNSKAVFDRHVLTCLQDMRAPEIISGVPREYEVHRPSHDLNLYFPERQAHLLEVAALGEHSILLAGPSGSGKSTIARVLTTLLQAPSQDEMHQIVQNNKGASETPLRWRPVVHPHHSTTALGLIGGGSPPFKGEITRAHKGVIILDELLEFQSKAQEALREPMEENCIRIRRGRYLKEYPAENLVVATTNLCPCGDWVPRAKVVCGRSLKRCQSYGERLSGPLVDRFQIVFFTQRKESGSVPVTQILTKLEEVRVFREHLAARDARFRKLSSRWSFEDLAQDLNGFYMRELFPQEMSSRRRELATLRVARTLADLEFGERLEPRHVEAALKMTLEPFEALKRMGN
ncbi:MAG: ATP-binding protein [Bdellovibrio sp.]